MSHGVITNRIRLPVAGKFRVLIDAPRKDAVRGREAARIRACLVGRGLTAVFRPNRISRHGGSDGEVDNAIRHVKAHTRFLTEAGL